MSRLAIRNSDNRHLFAQLFPVVGYPRSLLPGGENALRSILLQSGIFLLASHLLKTLYFLFSLSLSCILHHFLSSGHKHLRGSRAILSRSYVEMEEHAAQVVPTATAESAAGRITPTIQQSASIAESPPVNPFKSPYTSMPVSAAASSNALNYRHPNKYFHSRRIKKGEVERPWLDRKDPREKWVTIIPLIGLLLGLGVAGFLVWDGVHSVVNHVYCPVLIEDFSSGLDPTIWTKEVEVGGFGQVWSLSRLGSD